MHEDRQNGCATARAPAWRGFLTRRHGTVLDDLDRKTLTALIADARASFKEIGLSIGLSAPCGCR